MAETKRKTTQIKYDGIAVDVFVDGVDNMDIFDMADRYGTGHPFTVRAMSIALYGEDGYAKVRDTLKERHGVARVTDIDAFNDAILEKLNAKNSQDSSGSGATGAKS